MNLFQVGNPIRRVSEDPVVSDFYESQFWYFALKTNNDNKVESANKI
jgi:hypothetical protein